MNDVAKFCSNCGQPLMPGDRFCGGCGSSIADAPVPEEFSDPPEAVLKPSSGTRRKWYVALVGVAILVLIGLGAVAGTWLWDQYFVSTETMFFRAENYYYGTYSPKDIQEAVKWYHRAADRGHARAQDVLGFLYENGIGVNQDRAAALKWYGKAVEGGDTEAMEHLAAMHLSGQDAPKDLKKAVELWKRAAERGSANAQHNLGWIYLNELVRSPENFSEGIKWYREAARQGHAEAQDELRKMRMTW